jgi:hypothetical protein
MGLLDDAIREHLELKRRRGADPDEVARQEGEALGDPRSGEFAKPDADPAEAVAAEPEPVPVEAEPPPVYEPEPEPAAVQPPEPEPEPVPEPAPPAPATRDDAPWLEDDERLEPPAGQPTAEFTPPDVEPVPEDAPTGEPGADEDVLEETPDFLQETPEHDRLWFEQKPPRDFDFDS